MWKNASTIDSIARESNRTDEVNSSLFLLTEIVDSVTNGTLAHPRGQLLVAFLQCLIVLFTLLGNGLVVVAVASFRRLRSVTNYFVASLAVADLAVAFFVMPCSVLYGAWGKWISDWELCYFWISSDVMCCTASILHLCVIAVDRHFAIVEPLTYAARFSTRRPGIVIGAVWTCSVAISFVPIFAGWFKDDTFHLCDLNVNRVYAVVSSMTSFYCPLVVMVIVYARIYSVARRQSNEISRLEKSVSRKSRVSLRRNGRDLKAVKTLGTLMGLFCVSWLPFFVVYVVRPFYRRVPRELVLAVTWLGYCNSLFNPCIYALMNTDFLVAFKKLLLCRRNRRLDSKSSLPTPTVADEKSRVTHHAPITGDSAVDENIRRNHAF